MINRTLKLLAVLTAFAAGPLFAQDTYFSYDFDFTGVDEIGFALFEITELNEDGQLTGEWSGDDFPIAGDNLSSYFVMGCSEECPSSGIVQNPFEGNESMLFIDRPATGAVHYMNLTETIELPGSEFVVTVGTRRTGGSANAKSYDFFGVDSEGNESFRIRIHGDGIERLGAVTDGGSTVLRDLPTVIGEDMNDDIQNTGGPPFGVNDDIVTLTVRNGATGYSVVYENANGSNAYTTASIPFNGSGKDLARIGLSYGGVASDANQQVGFFVDDAIVTGFDELLLGDFDFDNDIDLEDFMAIANNFGTNNSEGDFNFNGVVDLEDWVGFFDAYQAANAPAGAASVPEPATGLMVLFGLLGMLAVRRRR